MSQNLNLLSERFNEIAATAALAQLTKRLNELATEPSTKRWARNRASASEAWSELRELAAARCAAAARGATTKRATTPKRAVAANPNDTPTATAAA